METREKIIILHTSPPTLREESKPKPQPLPSVKARPSTAGRQGVHRGGRRLKRRRLRPAWVLSMLTLLIIVLGLPIAIWRLSSSNGAQPLAITEPSESCLSRASPYYRYEDTQLGVASQIGIDVSTYQGNIDWLTVKAAGMEFAMLRLGFRGYESGKLALDSTFLQNAEGAEAAGIGIGVYFFSQAVTEDEAEEEARFVLEQLKNIPVTYPIAYDLEHYTASAARTDALTGEQATRNAIRFCETIQEAGYQPVIYMNGHWAAEIYDLNALAQYPIWFAGYRDLPDIKGGVAMWQYTDQGSVPGIENAAVDLNLMFVPSKR